jgi:acyl-CoA reductase-like NAD-dependent aldehyde dehydrogenase
MLRGNYPFYLAGKPIFTEEVLAVHDKFTGLLATTVAAAEQKHIEEAIKQCVLAEASMAAFPADQRRSALDHCVTRFTERKAELVEILCIEAGKPLRDARGEVDRLIGTFQEAIAQTRRPLGEVLSLEESARTQNYRGFWKRFPIGACSFVTPFNFPLNLVAHKVAPAIAAGCPFVLKPASLTPVSALVLGEVLAETSLPPGAFSILPCRREIAGSFSSDERLKLFSFTGSPAVGWDLKRRVGRMKVVLELGGNAACVVDQDWNVDDAVARVLVGAFGNSGQSCISVQRLFVHESIYAEFKGGLLQGVSALGVGNPLSESTVVGPMISEKEAERLIRWIESATASGAKLLAGGKRKGSLVEPTVLEHVPASEPVSSEEAFGPVVVLEPFGDFESVLKKVNASRFGLQAGVFTRDLFKAELAFETLKVGGVIVGDVPSWRCESMPYGGVKESGFGREGVRFAMDEMSEIRMRVLRV